VEQQRGVVGTGISHGRRILLRMGKQKNYSRKH
jgi:hypothetical protein